MAKRLDKREMVSFEELLISNMYEQEVLILLLEEKGILTRSGCPLEDSVSGTRSRGRGRR